MRLLLTRRSILDCCSFGYSKDRRRTHWSLEMKTESYYTVSSWIHLMHSIIMDIPNAQYHHGYTYCTVSSWIHILHSIVMDTHTAQHRHGYTSVLHSIVMDMNTAVPLSLGETFSLTILVELQVMAPLSGEGLVLAQCSLLVRR